MKEAGGEPVPCGAFPDDEEVLGPAMRKALALHQDAELQTRYRRNGMAAEFSWDHVVKQYLMVYRDP